MCLSVDRNPGVFYSKAHSFLMCNAGRRLDNSLTKEISTNFKNIEEEGILHVLQRMSKISQSWKIKGFKNEHIQVNTFLVYSFVCLILTYLLYMQMLREEFYVLYIIITPAPQTIHGTWQVLMYICFMNEWMRQTSNYFQSTISHPATDSTLLQIEVQRVTT